MSEMLQFPAGRAAPDAVSGAILTCDVHDNTIRWRPGERLHHLFERRAAALSAAGQSSELALDIDGVGLTFEQLDKRANQMARYLRSRGVASGDRVGLILDRSEVAYVVLLAVLKLEAAYVPLDAKFPKDRIAFIADDADIKAFIVTAKAKRLVDDLDAGVIELGAARSGAAGFGQDRLERPAVRRADDSLCYIIYTSGSTGRPKGVAVNHSSICNFVQVATEVYGYRPADRVYQGMTLAFDFSVEELWVPLMAGATLVPSPADRQLMGTDLGRFLSERRITAMCCVPTLLATIDDDLPDLRLLLVSGEACPQDIVARWQRPGRRMLNAYGPTEATVTATWTEVEAGKPVTIGVPLPTYSVAVIDPERNALVDGGAVGELAIAGIGLAEGYVNRPDLTEKAFIPDFLQLANNPSRRLYRTGDLARINDEGEIEYLGRIDTQVKIRGYRIELSEIESVLLEVDGVSQAVVSTVESGPGLVELAAYVTYFDGALKRPGKDDLLALLRSRLPGYMVPAYIEELDNIPLLASHKADRKALPRPASKRLVSRTREYVAARSDIEKEVARCLAETLKLEAVSVHDHFFDDLGAHSFLMGQFLATLNTRHPHLKAAISDVYLAPTVAQFAAELEGRMANAQVDVERAGQPKRAHHIASDFDYVRCGVLQALFYVVTYGTSVALAVFGAVWISMAGDLAVTLGRSLTFTIVTLAAAMALPVIVKWSLIGRWKAGRIPLWSLDYVRLWVARQVIETSPWRALKGTVLFNVYLRLLGARIGDSALILSRSVPVVTDLLSIGDRSVIRSEALLRGYRAESGFIELDRIDIGNDVVLGEQTVVDVGTVIGDDAQIGHASAVATGQVIPSGERHHGVPARRTETNFRRFDDRPVSLLRRSIFAALRLMTLVVTGTIAMAVTGLVVAWVGNQGVAGHPVSLVGAGWVLAFSLIVFAVLYVLAFVIHMTVPRLLRLMIKPNTIYPLYGFRHYVAGVLSGTSYSITFQLLYGDSSAIVHYLRWLGVRQPDAVQTGSNFGTTTAFESPFDVEFGRGAMVSDGLKIINFETGSGAFRLVGAQVGKGCFLGNDIVYPPGAKLGDNCLLGKL